MRIDVTLALHDADELDLFNELTHRLQTRRAELARGVQGAYPAVQYIPPDATPPIGGGFASAVQAGTLFNAEPGAPLYAEPPVLLYVEPTPEPTPEPARSITPADVENVLRAHLARHGMAATVELLGAFGVKRANELTDDARAAFVARANEAMTA